ncbi:MAG: hypothetical protein R3Y35_12580 [Clostridia bacterium]
MIFIVLLILIKIEYANLTKNYSAYIDDIIENTVAIEDIRLIRYYNQNVALFPEPLATKLKENEFCYKPRNLVSLSEYGRVYKLVWELFAKAIDSEVDFYIFDGSLFHHPINDLIHNYNANELQIISHINTLVSSISSCNCVIYYLQTDNVSTQLNKARISRNQSILSDSELLFWEIRKKIDLKVLKQIAIPNKIFDVSYEEWDCVVDNIVSQCINKDKKHI